MFTSTKFVVMTAAAYMPNSCWGNYGKVAVVETDGVNMPSQIHPGHKSVISIRYLADRLNKGKTSQCAFRRALARANEIAAELNGTVAA